MTNPTTSPGPILRIFEVQATPDGVETLLENFATTSAAVVDGQPGNQGYFFGRCVPDGDRRVLFVSLWADLESVKARFGDDWEQAYLPPGYDDLVERCSIRHVDTGAGWHVAVEGAGSGAGPAPGTDRE